MGVFERPYSGEVSGSCCADGVQKKRAVHSTNGENRTIMMVSVARVELSRVLAQVSEPWVEYGAGETHGPS